MRKPHRADARERPIRAHHDDGKFRVESTPEDQLEARVNALGLEGWDPVSVWRADGKTGMLQVILKRSEKPKAQKGK